MTIGQIQKSLHKLRTFQSWKTCRSKFSFRVHLQFMMQQSFCRYRKFISMFQPYQGPHYHATPNKNSGSSFYMSALFLTSKLQYYFFFILTYFRHNVIWNTLFWAKIKEFAGIDKDTKTEEKFVSLNELDWSRQF